MSLAAFFPSFFRHFSLIGQSSGIQCCKALSGRYVFRMQLNRDVAGRPNAICVVENAGTLSNLKNFNVFS